MGVSDISWVNLIFGSLILIIPILIFIYFKTGLAKPLVFSVARMSLQLFLVGIYLKYIFEWNNIYLNFL